MIKVYLSQDGYVIQSDKYNSNQNFTYYNDYESIDGNWYALMGALYELKNKKLNQEQIIICNASRLIEELQGKIEPTTSYSKSCLEYIRTFLKDFTWITLSKVDLAEIITQQAKCG